MSYNKKGYNFLSFEIVNDTSFSLKLHSNENEVSHVDVNFQKIPYVIQNLVDSLKIMHETLYYIANGNNFERTEAEIFSIEESNIQSSLVFDSYHDYYYLSLVVKSNLDDCTFKTESKTQIFDIFSFLPDLNKIIRELQILHENQINIFHGAPIKRKLKRQLSSLADVSQKLFSDDTDSENEKKNDEYGPLIPGYEHLGNIPKLTLKRQVAESQNTVPALKLVRFTNDPDDDYFSPPGAPMKLKRQSSDRNLNSIRRQLFPKEFSAGASQHSIFTPSISSISSISSIPEHFQISTPQKEVDDEERIPNAPLKTKIQATQNLQSVSRRLNFDDSYRPTTPPRENSEPYSLVQRTYAPERPTRNQYGNSAYQSSLSSVKKNLFI